MNGNEMIFLELGAKMAILDLIEEGYSKKAIMRAFSHPDFQKRVIEYSRDFKKIANGEEL